MRAQPVISSWYRNILISLDSLRKTEIIHLLSRIGLIPAFVLLVYRSNVLRQVIIYVLVCHDYNALFASVSTVRPLVHCMIFIPVLITLTPDIDLLVCVCVCVARISGKSCLSYKDLDISSAAAQLAGYRVLSCSRERMNKLLQPSKKYRGFRRGID